MDANAAFRKIDLATCSFAASALLVNAVAFIGQYGYATEHFGWGKPGDVLYAATIESVAVTVAAHAHQSQKNNDSALRTKLASYALGAVVGALNYSHYASHWHPTAKAVSLGLLSALSPWLWGMFSRRVSRDLLMAQGLLEGRAVKLGATRWAWHPIGSFRAMRWATWLGEQDPAVVIASAGTGRRREPGAARAAVPAATQPRELEPAPAGNRNPGPGNRGTGGTGNRERQPVNEGRELESGTMVIPEPEPARTGNREPGVPAAGQEPVRRPREPRLTPEEAATALVPAAREFIARWRAEHGVDPTTDQLRAGLQIKKTRACAVYRLIRWPAGAETGGHAEGAA